MAVEIYVQMQYNTTYNAIKHTKCAECETEYKYYLLNVDDRKWMMELYSLRIVNMKMMHIHIVYVEIDKSTTNLERQNTMM